MWIPVDLLNHLDAIKQRWKTTRHFLIRVGIGRLVEEAEDPRFVLLEELAKAKGLSRHEALGRAIELYIEDEGSTANPKDKDGE